MDQYPQELKEEWKKVMAKAWTEPDFMKELQKNPKEAINGVADELELKLLAADLENPDNDNYFPLPDPVTLSKNFLELPEQPTKDDYIKLLSNPEKGEKIVGLMPFCCP